VAVGLAVVGSIYLDPAEGSCAWLIGCVVIPRLDHQTLALAFDGLVQ
jgi:hypothetical protein